jgi:hypothetical protein
MEKELENSEKKEKDKASQPAQVGPARPRARVPAPPDTRTPPVSGRSLLPRALSLSLSASWGQPVGAVFFTRAPSLCLVGLDRWSPRRCPTRPFLLSLRRGSALSVSPPPRLSWTSACALTHVARFLSHDARPRAQLPS